MGAVVMNRLVCCVLCGRPQLSTACSVVTSRRLAIIMAHSRLGTAERQMWHWTIHVASCVATAVCCAPAAGLIIQLVVHTPGDWSRVNKLAWACKLRVV